jgi:hypothetical protein
MGAGFNSLKKIFLKKNGKYTKHGQLAFARE